MQNWRWNLLNISVKKITGKVMYGDESKENIKRYGFSVCAGIAYVHSHFPFYIGYEVAEACCDSAKDRQRNRKIKMVTELAIMWISRSVKMYNAAIWIV